MNFLYLRGLEADFFFDALPHGGYRPACVPAAAIQQHDSRQLKIQQCRLPLLIFCNKPVQPGLLIPRRGLIFAR
ncbi:hypothetical protein D3C75_1109330 [compost metagenome]